MIPTLDVLEKENYGDRKKIRSFQGFREGRIDRVQWIF